MSISLKGTVQTPTNTPVEGASVYLIGAETLLGDARSAAIRRPGEVTWSRIITGFSGHRWNCWQKFVMNQVAGITWPEFKKQVLVHNPVLIADGFVFKAEKSYRLPEQAPGEPLIVWTRSLTDFFGNRWNCWVQFVRGKVQGMTWNDFKEQVVEHNPALRDDGFVFLRKKTYWLPENVLGPTEIAWTRELTGFAGTLGRCWEEHVRDQVQGITWAEFREQVVEHNPVLREDDYLFKAEKTYVLPENRTKPLYYLFTTTDRRGRYTFPGLTAPGECELVVEAVGFHPYRRHLSLQDDTVHDITLQGLGPRMVSNWAGYRTASPKIRKLIDQALSMLGDDAKVFDSLPPDLQRLAWGFNFRDNPSDLYYKDIVCADLVTICLHAAGFDHEWEVRDPTGEGFTTGNAANYYRPAPGHPKLREVAEDEEWLPGDILIYWNGDLATNRVKHVNLYVGPFSGVDLSGNFHPASKGYDVVNASIDFFDPDGVEVGTAVRPVTRHYCLTRRFGYQHVRRMRHVDVEWEHRGPDTRGFIQVDGDEFVLDGRPFRFIGFNIRGLVHYGDPQILRHSRPEHRDTQLRAAREIGARVVRVFLGNRHRDTQEIGDRLEEVLDLAEQHNVYLIVAFTDFYGDTGFNPRGDERFYVQDPFGRGTLSKGFFAGGYRENYLPFVEAIVERFREHRRIFAWELGNELKAWQTIDGLYKLRPELFIEFATQVTEHIRRLDPVHLITTGIISTRNIGCNPEQAERLYSLSTLDFLTTHNYNGDDRENDVPLAARLGKPLIIEEAGFKGGNRAQRVRADLKKWFGRKVRGYLQWGFMATDHDMGDGDRSFGMDRALHGDWQALVETYRAFIQEHALA